MDTTGRGSVSCSALLRMETAEDAVISLKRLLTPCVDSFSKEVTFCVDSFKRSETVGANLLCPFKSLLSMLIAKSMEFRPTPPPNREKSGVSAIQQSHSNTINKLQTLEDTRGYTLVSNGDLKKQTKNSHKTGVRRHRYHAS